MWKCLRWITFRITPMAERRFTLGSYRSSSPRRRSQRAGRCRSSPPWWGPSSGGTDRREGRRTWWRQTHPWSPFYTGTQQGRVGKLEITAGDWRWHPSRVRTTNPNSPGSCGFWVRVFLSLLELRPTLACHYCHTCSPSCLRINTASWSRQRPPHLVKCSTSWMFSSKISWFLRGKAGARSTLRRLCGWAPWSPSIYNSELIPYQVLQDFCHSSWQPPPPDVNALPVHRCVPYRWAQEGSAMSYKLFVAFLLMKRQHKRSLMRFWFQKKEELLSTRRDYFPYFPRALRLLSHINGFRWRLSQ